MVKNTSGMPELTDKQNRKLAETFLEFQAEYRTEPQHHEVVYEDDDKVIVADHTGHEINELANYLDIDRSDLLQLFHHTAKFDTDYSWSVSDPVVFPKFVDRQDEYEFEDE